MQAEWVEYDKTSRWTCLCVVEDERMGKGGGFVVVESEAVS